MMAYCGLRCTEECEAYTATQNNDEELMQKVLHRWLHEYQQPQTTLESLYCDGCKTENGRLNQYCSECEVRLCARSRQLNTCADCPDFSCEKLQKIINMAPYLQDRLEKIRQG